MGLYVWNSHGFVKDDNLNSKQIPLKTYTES